MATNFGPGKALDADKHFVFYNDAEKSLLIHSGATCFASTYSNVAPALTITNAVLADDLVARAANLALNKVEASKAYVISLATAGTAKTEATSASLATVAAVAANAAASNAAAAAPTDATGLAVKDAAKLAATAKTLSDTKVPAYIKAAEVVVADADHIHKAALAVTPPIPADVTDAKQKLDAANLELTVAQKFKTDADVNAALVAGQVTTAAAAVAVSNPGAAAAALVLYNNAVIAHTTAAAAVLAANPATGVAAAAALVSLENAKAAYASAYNAALANNVAGAVAAAQTANALNAFPVGNVLYVAPIAVTPVVGTTSIVDVPYNPTTIIDYNNKVFSRKAAHSVNSVAECTAANVFKLATAKLAGLHASEITAIPLIVETHLFVQKQIIKIKADATIECFIENAFKACVTLPYVEFKAGQEFINFSTADHSILSAKINAKFFASASTKAIVIDLAKDKFLSIDTTKSSKITFTKDKEVMLLELKDKTFTATCKKSLTDACTDLTYVDMTVKDKTTVLAVVQEDAMTAIVPKAYTTGELKVDTVVITFDALSEGGMSGGIIFLIIALAVVVVGVAGFGGYKAFQSYKK